MSRCAGTGRGAGSSRGAGAGRRAGRGGRAWLLCGAIASILGCSGEAEPPVAGAVLREGVDMVIFEMRTFVTREGIRRARLEADTAEFLGENEIHMRPVMLTFFGDDGSESTVITADFGIFHELTEDMEAEGSVVVLDRQDDQRLETEKLRYIRAEDRLYGDVPFTLWSDGGATRLEGSQFDSDPNLDSFRVPSPSGSSERRGPPAGAAGPSVGDTATAPDSAAVPPTDVSDTTSAPAAAATDTASAPPDTSSAPPDSVSSPPDTRAAHADRASAAAARRSGRG